MTHGKKSGKSTEEFSPADFVRRLKKEKEEQEGFDYRRASLAMHGHICARCGREFSGRDLQLLTVHHKDGNHFNNPRDGSNWENLCVYCHEDIHARGVLASMLAAEASENGSGPDSSAKRDEKSEGMVSLADKLRKALGGNK